MQVLVILEAWS